MDFVDRIVGHDIWFTNRLLDRAQELDPQKLDQPVFSDWSSAPFGINKDTLRSLLNEMVANKENWSASLAGRSAPTNGGTSIDELKRRYAVAAEQFSDLVKDISRRGRWDEGFVDALCDPPQSFTYGGMLAHVATFSAFRRTMAVLMFRRHGIDDLGIGDPIEWERQRK